MARTLSPPRPVSGGRDRRQPTLFDRLVEPVLTDSMKSIDALAPPARMRRNDDIALRGCVLRDMARLLNATRLLDASEAQAYPHVARSVLNYGVLPLAGTMISEVDLGYVEDAIRQALMHYEPRLLPESIEVRCTGGDAQVGHRNVLTFEIAAKLWCMPRPVPMLVYTDVDLESGAASVRTIAER